MSTAASPAPSEGESKRGEVTYRFCQECSNLLYPKEDRSTSQLLFVCKACHHTEQFENACTYRNQLGSNVTETAGVTTDVANDPTVGSHALMLPCFCTMCGDQVRCGRCGKPAMEDSDMSEYSNQEEVGGRDHS